MSLSIDVTDGMAFFLRSSLELWREGAHRLTQNQMVIVDKTNHKFRDVEPSLHLNKAEDVTPVRHDDLFQLKLVVEVRRSQRFMFPRFTLLRMGRGASRLVPIVSRGDRELDGDARTGVASSWSWPSILLTPLIETRHRDRNRARRSIFFFFFGSKTLFSRMTRGIRSRGKQTRVLLVGKVYGKLITLKFSCLERRSSWSALLSRSGRDAATLTKRRLAVMTRRSYRPAAVDVGAQVFKRGGTEQRSRRWQACVEVITKSVVFIRYFNQSSKL